MGFFSFKKTVPAVPTKPVPDWTKEDVSLWAKASGLPKACRTALAGVSGKRLLQVQDAEIQRLFVSKPDPDSLQLITQALQKLKAQTNLENGPPKSQVGAPPPVRTTAPPRIQFQAPVLPGDQGSSEPQTTSASGQRPTLQEQIQRQQRLRSEQARLEMPAIAPEEDVLSPAMGEQRAWEQQQLLTHPELSKGFRLTDDMPLMGNHIAYRPHHKIPSVPTLMSAPVPTTPSRMGMSDVFSPGAYPSPSAMSEQASPSVSSSTANLRQCSHDGGRVSPMDGGRMSPMDGGRSSSLAAPCARPRVGSQKFTDAAGAEQALRDHADYLCKYMGSKVNIQEVAEFLQPLERTKGLVELCQRNPSAGSVVAAIYQTYMDCFNAVCCLQNASRLQDFCLDITCLLEAAGKKGIEVDQTLCKELVNLFKQASEMIAIFSNPGWLLHMAFMQNIKGRFDSVHNQIVQQVQAHHLDSSTQSKTLMLGDYKDPSRSMRRVLKQLGKGSIADGIYEVIATNIYRSKIGAVMEVSETDLGSELANFPQGDQSVDLAMLYDNLIAGKVTAKMNDADLIDHEKIFDWYDQGRKGYMDMADLKSLLLDLGMLESVKDKDQFVATQMSMADKDQTRSLSLQEFSNYYSSLVFSGERHQLRTKMGIEAENEVKHQFLAFSGYGIRSEAVSAMDGKTFAKYAHDCKLIDSKLRNTTVDLIFCKVKAKGARRIDFDRFLHALSLIAEKKKISFVQVVTHCLQYDGPVTTATRAENTRLHDDKSTYTGVYARGGPTNVEPMLDLAHIADRSRADARGVKLPPAPRLWNAPQLRRSTTDGSQTHRRFSMGTPNLSSMHSLSLSSTGESRRLSVGGSYNVDRSTRMSPLSSKMGAEMPVRRAMLFEGLDDVQNTFVSFAMFGKRVTDEDFDALNVKLDGAGFAKLCKESMLMDHRLNASRVDLIFAKFCDHKTKRMSYKCFLAALPALAEAKGVDPVRIQRSIEVCPGPMLKGTIAAAVRWHDDKNNYTGVYARGGPTNVDKKMNLEDMVDRSDRQHRNSLGPRDFQTSFR